MKVKVFIERENKRQSVSLKDNSTAMDLLKSLNINPVTVVLSINKEMVTEDHKLKDKDDVFIHSVISGG